MVTFALLACITYKIYIERVCTRENSVEDKPPEIQPKRQRQRRRSKPRHGKNINTVTGENNTLDDAEDNEDPIVPTSEQEEREDERVSPNEQTMNEDSEDSNYLSLSEDELSLCYVLSLCWFSLKTKG